MEYWPNCLKNIVQNAYLNKYMLYKKIYAMLIWERRNKFLRERTGNAIVFEADICYN